MAFEYTWHSIISEKCDVYSFGMVLVDVPIEENIDPNIKGNIAPECWRVFFYITHRCLKFEPDERQTMGEVERTNPLRKRSQTVIEELCHRFSVAEIRKSTNNFDEKRKIGREDFNDIYKGCLKLNGANDIFVRIKRLRKMFDQGVLEFKKEVELLCQLRHPNVVTLIGFCDHKDEKIIVYEYVANGSLYDHLYCSNMKMEPLTWKQRLKICVGVARGLHYLHTGAKRTIFHRDIKPSNILLNNNMVPKLSNFELSLQGSHCTSKPKPTEVEVVAGTIGYIAPENFQNKSFSDKSDVYSFGKLLLEMVCTEKRKIVERLRHPVERNIDPNLKGKIVPECWEVYMEMTQRCLEYDPNERPTMGEVEVQLEHALSMQAEADDKKASGDYYSLLSFTIINPRK
ncbi:receptor-like protein kinase ANXUR2 [Abrus precatorius]|uniref:Receptor-like protein kinase ANXUR2 n=1 Tax=Abrus precatorius TaxID=3816 RepID=A0A8B8L560_ABRPR|nr:receptor-like protein kinase ANXUR2 [Abrus precatorius]